jgi:predicted dehydrogenase
MFMKEIQHFRAVANGHAEPACTLEDGVEVMRLITAVQASSRSGRAITTAT